MCNPEAVIQPDEKLKKMLVFAKIILLINIISAFLRLFIRPSDMIYDLFTCLFLFMAYNSVYFIYMAIYLVFSLFNMVMLFISSGILLQMVIQKTIGVMKKSVALVMGVQLYLLIFYIFAIIFTFPIYKEMRAQLNEHYGGGSSQNRDNSDSNPNLGNSAPSQDIEQGSNSAPTVNRNFVPFSGRGVAVG